MTATNVKDFIKQHKALALVLLLLLTFGAGFGTAVVSHPAKVVEKTKVVTVTKTVEIEKKQMQEQLTQKRDATRDQHVHRVVVQTKKPDGTVTTTTTEDVNTDSAKHEQAQETKIQYVDREVVKWQERIVQKEKTVLSQPNWSVYAGVGLDVPYFLGQGPRGIPGLNGFVVQAGIDRRIVGPFWLGIFGNTEGVAGVNLRMVW